MTKDYLKDLNRTQLREIINILDLPIKGNSKDVLKKRINDYGVSEDKIESAYRQIKKSKVKKIKPKKKLVENIFSINFSLFTALELLKIPNYSNILTFLNSFGLGLPDLTPYLINKINDGDVVYSKINHPDLDNFLKFFLANGKTPLPITLKIIQFHNDMENYRHLSIMEFVTLLKALEKQFPYLFSLNSSIHGAPEDLLTVNQIFPETIIFKRNNRWRV